MELQDRQKETHTSGFQTSFPTKTLLFESRKVKRKRSGKQRAKPGLLRSVSHRTTVILSLHRSTSGAKPQGSDTHAN